MTLGQIGIVGTTGFTSWVIRLVTRSSVNHAVIDTGRCVVSAEPGGVRYRAKDYFPGIVWSKFLLTSSQAEEVAAFAVSQLGKPYGYFDDLAIGVGLITRTHTPKWLTRWLASRGQWQCAALADASLRAAGEHVWHDDRPVGAVYPGSFERVFEDRGWMPQEAPAAALAD